MLGHSETRHVGLAGDGRYGLPTTPYQNPATWHPYPKSQDEPLDQDVAVRHLDGEPEASKQADWSDDTQLLGHVIEVSDAADGHIHRRTMVVLAVTAIKFLQCVLVCRHPQTQTHGPEFYMAHIHVVDSRRASEQRQHVWQETVLPVRVVNIVIEDRGRYALRDNCYINLQHAWTVRNELMFRNIGIVADFQELKANFREVQRILYGDS